ncbi:electron transport complex protein RnfC [Syntrophus gentianae]|uniref:Ion-translocating oxidoreductase complex subunit C n=1 Tax=Syntrophus gentianae TaxID=43775 RepID=A0A1H7VSY7_9BACT|nr:electron transport complex subunit RsxC [Syntrophus gentianae]SEM11917.1 electron transport complex protein RnfC [Syntrophus gentianae]
MSTSLLTFAKGGVHPQESKEIAEHLAIEKMPLPEEFEIPLLQHFGAPCQPLAKKKDRVEEGDLIGQAQGLGANVHASVTGTVTDIGTSKGPVSLSVPSITIARDLEAPDKVYSPSDWKGLTSQELLQKIKDAGIVGIGGAGFPAHVKLAPPPGTKVDKLVLNGAECEPYLTTDHRVMLEKPEEVIEGTKILLRVLGISEGHIGVEANKKDAIEVLRKALEKQNLEGLKITVDALQVKYPQGSEKQLIESVTGRKVPGGGLPFDVGVIVQNIGTTKAIYDAVVLNKPLYEKVVTISGRGIARPANLQVRVGTRISDIVRYLGGTKPDLAKIVMGGPMMGFAVSTLDIPVTKTVSGVLFLTRDEIDDSPYGPCIRCGWCLEACPMGLSPNEIGLYVEAGRSADTAQFGVFDCFECGSCSFVCPSKRPLVQFIRLAKQKAKR